MAIERQAVQGLQQVQSQGAPRASMIQSRVAGAPTLSQKSGLLDSLLNVAGSAAAVATQVMNTTIEEDKIIQYDRNLRGLLPTDDATVGGRRAHMLVNLQNRTDEVVARLQDDATRFQGTDEEWEEHMLSYQRALREEVALNYPELADDKDTAKTITTALMEKQPQVFAARATSKLKNEAQERASSLESRVLSMTEGLEGENLTGMLHQLQREAVAMQITKPEYESLIVNIAMERAAAGDASMIEATKGIKDANGVSLYSRNGKLMAAEVQAARTATSLDQVGLYETKSVIENGLLGDEITWSEFLNQARVQNEATGGSAWSEAEITALYNKKAKMAGEEAKSQGFLAALSGESPAGLRDFSEKERKDGAKVLRARSNELAEAEIQRLGLTGEQAENLRGQYEQQRYMIMAKNALKDPVAGERFESLMLMTPEHLKTMTEEPEAMQTLMRMYQSLPSTGRDAVMGEKEHAFADNYERALRMGYNPGQAIQFAQDAAKSTRLSSETLKNLNKVTEGVVSEVASGGWSFGDNMSDLGKDLMMQEATQIALAKKQAGFSDESIERDMKAYLESQYTQTQEGFFKSGVLVKGVKDNSALGAAINTNPADTATALKQYLTNNKEKFLDDAAGFSEEEMYFDIDQKKGTFVVRAGTGRVPVTSARPLSEIDGQKLIEQQYEEAKKLRDENKAAFEEQMMKRGSWGSSNSERYKKSANVTFNELSKTGLSEFFMSSAFASGTNLPTNFEFNHQKNNETFYDYVAKQENSINAGFNRLAGTYEPYDSDTKTAGTDTIGFGHKLTRTEKRNGYIEIDGQKVPYQRGSSQLTPELARKLLEQDVKAHVPNTSDWKLQFKDMHPSVQRGLQDLAFNLGRGGIDKAPKALAAFQSGKITDGFIHMLATASENGKRSTGLLVRRAEAYNMANETSGIPKIVKVEANEDGSMRVKFDGSMDIGFISADIRNKISEDGWLTVYGSKKGALHPRSRPGTINLK